MNCYLDKLDSPIGLIDLAAIDEGLVYCGSHRIKGPNMETWLNKYLPEFELKKEENHIIKMAKHQLREYFAGKSEILDVPLYLVGTDFRKKVWKALRTIPYGQTRTYGQIAKQIGNPKGPRAVGQANHNNPISYFVP